MQTQETVVKKRQTTFVIFVRNLYLIQKGVAHKPRVKFIQLLSKVFLRDFYWGRLTTRVEKAIWNNLNMFCIFVHPRMITFIFYTSKGRFYLGVGFIFQLCMKRFRSAVIFRLQNLMKEKVWKNSSRQRTIFSRIIVHEWCIGQIMTLWKCLMDVPPQC